MRDIDIWMRDTITVDKSGIVVRNRDCNAVVSLTNYSSSVNNSKEHSVDLLDTVNIKPPSTSVYISTTTTFVRFSSAHPYFSNQATKII